MAFGRSGHPRPRRSPLVLGAVLGVALSGGALSACGTAAPPALDRTGHATGAPGSAPTTGTGTTTTTSTTVPAQPGWTPVTTSSTGVVLDTRVVVGADGSQVTLFRVRAGQARFNLHDGSEDPPTGSSTLGPNSGPAVSAAERPLLLAAFNGGFMVAADAGGTEIDGQTLVPLLPGMASLVVDSDGTAHIGVWGSSVPVPGEEVASVRQNLPPLLDNGQPSPDIDDVADWGATLGGGAAVARSALGEDAAGDIIYAGSMSAVPSDLASALADNGATVAMELDINPEWVQFFSAPTAGGPLSAGIPGQLRPADQYLAGWVRDFVTVLAPPGLPPAG